MESMGFLIRLYRVVALQNEEVFPGLDFWVTQPFSGYQLLHLPGTHSGRVSQTSYY